MGEDLFHLGVKALIVNGAGQVLLLKVNPEQLKGISGNSANYWDLPGGRIHRGASVKETLVREVEEELGVRDLTVLRPIGMVLSNIRIPLRDGSDVGLVLSVYECCMSENAVLTISSEHLSYEWFTVKEAAKLLAVKYPKEFCEQVANL